MFLSLVLQFTLVLLSSAAPADPPPSTPSAPPPPQPTICGDIVNSCNISFTAKQAYDCLNSVPFNAAIASNFIKYVNDTIQFQSTLAYLKNPPASYQQPSVDVLGGLQKIQQDIDQGAFHNQYAFEATLQNLIYAAHDAHLSLDSGILAAFSWFSPYSLVSLSKDGVQEPKVYVLDDVYLSQDPNSTFQPSAVKTINDRDSTDFLLHIAAGNSFGNIEPHADWNDLMSSWATYVQDDYSILENYIEFYPGETIAITFENGTQLDPTPWLANYNSPGPTGPLATGGDFFNFFALGFYPASFNASAPDPCSSSDSSDDTSDSTSTDSSDAPAASSWPGTAYPETADIFQPDLYPDGGGFLTGYFLRDVSTAVLSIPTFEMSSDDILSFSTTVAKFLEASHKAGMQKILIDLQQNLGGKTLLAVDTFKKFFPTKDAFRGTRFRSHPTADVLGTTLTTYFQSGKPNSTIYDALVGNVWVAADRLNAATKRNFTSWGESFGPHEYNGDLFSTVEQDNITSTIVDKASAGQKIDGNAEDNNLPQYYQPENIAILTDGLCASTCALFVELMHHGIGVKTVVVGGLPHSGPMQAAAGTRGYQDYDSLEIDYDILAVEELNKTTKASLPDRTVDMLITSFRINIRDQIRENDNTPLQFLYDAADCRIFYTADSWNNYTTLWTYASNAVFTNNALCVSGSTGHATAAGVSSTTAAPSDNYNPTQNDSSYAYNAELFTSGGDNSIMEGSFVPETTGPHKENSAPPPCDNHGNPCAVGTCKFNSKGGKHTYQGRTFEFRSGTCPQNSSPSSSLSLANLITGPDQAPEVHGDASREGSGVGTLILSAFV